MNSDLSSANSPWNVCLINFHIFSLDSRSPRLGGSESSPTFDWSTEDWTWSLHWCPHPGDGPEFTRQHRSYCRTADSAIRWEYYWCVSLAHCRRYVSWMRHKSAHFLESVFPWSGCNCFLSIGSKCLGSPDLLQVQDQIRLRISFLCARGKTDAQWACSEEDNNCDDLADLAHWRGGREILYCRASCM